MTIFVYRASSVNPKRGKLSGWTDFPTEFQSLNIPLPISADVGTDRTPKNDLQSDPSSAKSISMSEVDAKIAAAEARTDTKFAEMMGELRLINQKLEHVEKSTSGIRLNIWLAAATAVGLVVAVFSWGTSMFGVGMDAQSIADQSAKNALTQIQPAVDQLGTAVKNSNDRLSEIMAIFERIEKNPPAQTTPNQ